MPIRQTVLLLALAFSSLQIAAQTYFQKTYSFQYVQDFVTDMEVLSDGRIALLGSTHVKNDLNTRTLLMLLDANGEIIWAKTLLVEKSNAGTSLSISQDGNLIVGLNASEASKQSRPGILKIATDTGDILWETYFSLPEYGGLSGITPLSGGGYVITLNRQEIASLSIAGFAILFKIDENGNIVWEKTLADSQKINCWYTVENSSGELFVTGHKIYANRNILIKLSPAGDVLWSKSEAGMYIQNACIDEEDKIWLVGLGIGQDSSSRLIRIEKLDADGNIILSKSYDPNLTAWMDMGGIHALAGGSILVTGHDALVGKSNTIIAKINSSGEVLWAKKYFASNVNDYLLSVASTVQGDIIATGSTGAVFEDLDIWVVKTDPAGNIPDCCQTDFALTSTDVSAEYDTLDIIISSTLLPFMASAITEPAAPTVSTKCPMPAGEHASSPNAFTPNGDGINDLFRPRFECPPETLLFAVYDRWGKKVFETRDPESPGWDGTFDGKHAASDVYIWRVEYEAIHNGKWEKLSGAGDVALLR